MLNDLRIINKIRGGDIKAFESLFRHYYSPLCLYAVSITGRQEIAEEIVQDLFYIFWKDREKIRLLHSLKSYLYGAVRNKALQYCEHMEVRNRHREAILNEKAESPASHTPQDLMEYKELEEVVKRTLKQLPERRLRIFKMHRDEGMKYAEIATTLSLSIKTVEAEMTKALQTLRKEVEIYTQTQ
ncbi:MAG: RNA polymerase sigma-70 factor [Tannerellaceae bacterium]|nr:RNA polymerase sigma-70 factor [Tannerellaceae bacterium]